MQKKYEYGGSWKITIFAIVFFSACTVSLFMDAQENNRGAIINHLIELDTSETSIFLYILSGLTFLFVVIGIIMVIAKLRGQKNFIELNSDNISIITSSRFKPGAVIPYESIIDVYEVKISGQVFLYIKTDKKKYSIGRFLMPSKNDYEELHQFLLNKVIERQAS